MWSVPEVFISHNTKSTSAQYTNHSTTQNKPNTNKKESYDDILPRNIKCVPSVVVNHSVNMSHAQITHCKDKYNFLHQSWLHKPHYRQADGGLGKQMPHLPNIQKHKRNLRNTDEHSIKKLMTMMMTGLIMK